jgi:hypothetical protein
MITQETLDKIFKPQIRKVYCHNRSIYFNDLQKAKEFCKEIYDFKESQKDEVIQWHIRAELRFSYFEDIDWDEKGNI